MFRAISDRVRAVEDSVWVFTNNLPNYTRQVTYNVRGWACCQHQEVPVTIVRHWCVSRREWMGCWGLLGLFLVLIMDNSLIPYVQHQ